MPSESNHDLVASAALLVGPVIHSYGRALLDPEPVCRLIEPFASARVVESEAELLQASEEADAILLLSPLRAEVTPWRSPQKAGGFRGATDVYFTERLPADKGRDLSESLVVTPHSAYNTSEAAVTLVANAVQNIIHYPTGGSGHLVPRQFPVISDRANAEAP